MISYRENCSFVYLGFADFDSRKEFVKKIGFLLPMYVLADRDLSSILDVFRLLIRSSLVHDSGLLSEQ